MQWIPNEKKEPPEAGDYIEVTGRWGKRFVEILDPIKGNGDIVRFYFDPPQPEQEPVAWELRAGKTDRVLIEITNNPQRAHDWKASLEEVVPLYTTPPKREWQSLTDDEIKEIIGSYSGPIKGYTRELFDKIEAKLREKNT